MFCFLCSEASYLLMKIDADRSQLSAVHLTLQNRALIEGEQKWATPPERLGLSGRNSGKFWKDPGKALRAFPGIPLESTAGMPQTL